MVRPDGGVEAGTIPAASQHPYPHGCRFSTFVVLGRFHGGRESDALTCPKVEDLIKGPAVGSSAGGGSTKLSKGGQKAFNAVTQDVSASKLGLPSARRCLTHRVIRFHVVAPVHKVKVRSAIVQVNGKTVRHVTGDNKPVTLRNLKGSTVKVRLVVIGSDGRRYIGKRTYHLCAVKRQSKYHRKPARKKPAPKKPAKH